MRRAAGTGRATYCSAPSECNRPAWWIRVLTHLLIVTTVTPSVFLPNTNTYEAQNLVEEAVRIRLEFLLVVASVLVHELGVVVGQTFNDLIHLVFWWQKSGAKVKGTIHLLESRPRDHDNSSVAKYIDAVERVGGNSLRFRSGESRRRQADAWEDIHSTFCVVACHTFELIQTFGQYGSTALQRSKRAVALRDIFCARVRSFWRGPDHETHANLANSVGA